MSDQVLVGDIPQQPPGFQPRPDLLGQLNRAGRGVSVVTAMRGWVRRSLRLHTRG